MSLVELRRIFSEWNIRLKRVQEVLQPPVWSDDDWNQFAKTIATIVRKYGKTWEDQGTTYFDLRWQLSGGGELVCQFDENPDIKRSLVVAQHGGFADGTENYIWFYCEFNEAGQFIGDPFWVDGNWKDALAMMFMPQKMPSQFYLADGGAPVGQNLIQEESSTTWEHTPRRQPVPVSV